MIMITGLRVSQKAQGINEWMRMVPVRANVPATLNPKDTILHAGRLHPSLLFPAHPSLLHRPHIQLPRPDETPPQPDAKLRVLVRRSARRPSYYPGRHIHHGEHNERAETRDADDGVQRGVQPEEREERERAEEGGGEAEEELERDVCGAGAERVWVWGWGVHGRRGGGCWVAGGQRSEKTETQPSALYRRVFGLGVDVVRNSIATSDRILVWSGRVRPRKVQRKYDVHHGKVEAAL
ncbi:hypothetical protein C8R43DRAFT_960877 [Mycena crocata]|nr:hypothetical protein C8R43DRAFT_960877 [Mycena crocata]